MAITKDDYQIWKSHPITEWVLKAMSEAAMLNKAEWISRSWEGGEVDKLILTELRTRADSYLALDETSYEKMCELNGDTPQ